MARPVNPNPIPRVSTVRAKQKNGWTHIQKVTSVYDPKTKNRKRLSSIIIGKLPPGETDLSKMVPVRQRAPKGTRSLEKVIDPMKSVNDPRDQTKIIYPLDTVLTVILLAAMNKLTSCSQIASYWKTNREELKSFFSDFPEKDISHDTVRRLLLILGKQSENQLLQLFNHAMDYHFAQRVVAVDGQSVKAARINGAERAPYLLNFMDADDELILSQKVIGNKENEITQATSAISSLNIEGAIVTCDALNTQVKFANQIVKQRADYCLAVKANHSTLYEHIKSHFELDHSNFKVAAPKHETRDSKIENRRLKVLPSSLLLETVREGWPGLDLGCIIQAITESVDKNTGVCTTQTRYYISSLNYGSAYVAEVIMRAIRQHWAIENKGHWNLDVFFQQDKTQCRNAYFLAARCLINKIALNFYAKIQARLQMESDKKKGISKPEIAVYLTKLPNLLEQLGLCMKN